MAVQLLNQPPSESQRAPVGSPPDAAPGPSVALRLHESAGVRIRVTPAIHGFTGSGLQGAVWLSEK